MTGMERAIEQAAEVLNFEGACCGDCGREPGDPLSECAVCELLLTGYARVLADAGLLAPAPLREEWAAIGDDGHVLMRYGADSHSPHREYGTSLTYSRWASDWKPWEDDR